MTIHVCPLCLNNTTNDIGSKLTGSVTSDLRYLDFALAYKHCESCGYIYRDRDHRIDNSEFYTREYEFLLDAEDLERVMYEESASKYSEYLVNFLAEFIQNPKGKTCLEIGAGKGSFVASLYKLFPDVEISAVEPSKSFHVLNENKYLKHCYNKFFSSRDFISERFDYINMSEVLEHVLKPKHFLEDVKNIMSDDSLLIISVPNVENDKYDFLSSDHISRFTPVSLKNLFKVVGLEIIKSSIPPRYASMLFIVKKTHVGQIEKCHSSNIITSSLSLIESAIEDANKIKDEKVAIYGQGLIIHYLLGQGILSRQNISCIIDDNRTYHGKQWKKIIDIVSIDDFLTHHSDVKNIFLAMNECYHEQVLAKLPGTYKIYGRRHQ